MQSRGKFSIPEFRIEEFLIPRTGGITEFTVMVNLRGENHNSYCIGTACAFLALSMCLNRRKTWNY